MATCVSCHRPHEILPASDPASSVSSASRAKTCGRCHHGISAAIEMYRIEHPAEPVPDHGRR